LTVCNDQCEHPAQSWGGGIVDFENPQLIEEAVGMNVHPNCSIGRQENEHVHDDT